MWSRLLTVFYLSEKKSLTDEHHISGMQHNMKRSTLQQSMLFKIYIIKMDGLMWKHRSDYFWSSFKDENRWKNVKKAIIIIIIIIITVIINYVLYVYCSKHVKQDLVLSHIGQCVLNLTPRKGGAVTFIFLRVHSDFLMYF